MFVLMHVKGERLIDANSSRERHQMDRNISEGFGLTRSNRRFARSTDEIGATWRSEGQLGDEDCATR